MEKNLHTAVYRRLVTSDDLVDVLGDSPRCFYRLAPRDTAFPYICYEARLADEDNEAYFVKSGLLTFDIWTYQLNSDLSYAVATVIRRLFNRKQIPIDGVVGLRLYHKTTIEASVENNRSNRRSEDERLHRREMTFIVRGIDDEECDEYLEIESSWTS